MERNLITDDQHQLRKKYEKLWRLQVRELVASTATSQVYQVETDNRVAILKIYTDLGVIDEKGGASCPLSSFVKNADQSISGKAAPS